MKEKNVKIGQTASDVVALVDELLKRAIGAQASDIHVDPGRTDLVIRFRLDGVLKEIERLPQALTENIVSRLKVLGGLLTYRNDVPQEGRLEIPPDLGGQVTDMRLAIFPTIHGQRAVIRLFYQNKGLNDLEQLGCPPPVLDQLHRFAAGHQGVLLVTGPAGSGKSTTLAALLRHILTTTPGRSVVTLEDPVEIEIDGATQVQITPHGEMNFPTALRSLLRQDPQVVMIGEIRDAETARIAIEAGLTGHLVATTMHSGSPAGALLRLLEMGVEPYQVTSSVTAVLNQRLIRRLCPHCKTDEAMPKGCEHCLGTGFHQRSLLVEAIGLDNPLRQALLEKTDLDSLEALLAARGHRSLWQHGQELVDQGQTSLAELKQCLGVYE